ncbi:outer membrane protein assembly factor BamE [Marinobacterium arenosum]|uniref:outer membrane protein assembly factor BamE n=1 Tax=Marinobacterium arenosum TaxID=2862496 RepID=UPI001C93B0F1|nr:outer membrane protein assembly factor BamE [Marinobacterium arenosum]MBY4677371.1 outer membrane protein assembly factor BamE [Marinobacterium arenosum]
MIRTLVTISIFTFFLTACSDFPGVYKIDIPQGNVVTQEMVDQLRPGMTRKQVRFVMGTPLIEDTFHADRWDYILTRKSGDGSYSRQKLTLRFENDRLVGLNGDFRPGANQP